MSATTLETRRRTRRSSISAECPVTVVVEANPRQFTNLSPRSALFEQLRAVLSTHFLFGALQSDDAWRSLASSLDCLHVAQGSAVITQGDEGHALYLVKSGTLQVTKNGQDLPVTYSRLGDLFGELALLYNSPRAATVRAVTDAEVWVLSRAHFTLLLRDVRGEWRRRLVQRLATVLPSGDDDDDDALKLVADCAGEKTLVAGTRFSLPFFIVLTGDVVVVVTTTAGNHDDDDDAAAVVHARENDCVLDGRECVVQSAEATLAWLDAASVGRLLPTLRALARVPSSPHAFVVGRNEFATSVRPLRGKSFASVEDYVAFVNGLGAAAGAAGAAGVGAGAAATNKPAERRRRVSVSAEVATSAVATLASDNNADKSTVALEPWEQALFDEAMGFFIFSGLSAEERVMVRDRLRGPEFHAKGSVIIAQGDASGNCVYVVRSGELAVEKDGARLAAAYRPGAVFGELAMLYSAPRAATVLVTSAQGASLWSLERQAINRVVIQGRAARRLERESVIGRVGLFNDMTDSERARLVDVLVDATFAPGQEIIRQGDSDRARMKLYVVVNGSAAVYVDGALVRDVHADDYFGDVALLSGSSGARTATVKATEHLTCMYVDAVAFERVLGPLPRIKRRLAQRQAMYLV